MTVLPLGLAVGVEALSATSLLILYKGNEVLSELHQVDMMEVELIFYEEKRITIKFLDVWLKY